MYLYSPSRVDQKDIVDEAIEFFRANILFRNFEQSGPADLMLCYLTIYISELLRHFARGSKTAAEARKNVTQVSLSQTFPLPGDSQFCLAGFFSTPASRGESDLARSYFYQIRQELGSRLVDVIYNADGSMNKWWFMFQKRKFMNVERT
jgi:actin related protein 2/3 complex subunit 3